MSTVQGNLLGPNGEKLAPNTIAAAIYDTNKQQGLLQTLIETPDKNALGFASFSSLDDYEIGDRVYYNNRLYEFTSAHTAGVWNSAHVKTISIKSIFDNCNLDDIGEVTAAAIAYLHSEINGLKAIIRGYQIDAQVRIMDASEYRVLGAPHIIRSSVAGAPSASNIPDNWDEETMGVWTGVPRDWDWVYRDLASAKEYHVKGITNSVNDWFAIN